MAVIVGYNFYLKNWFSASGKKTNLWVELVEWLVEQGAKKFIIALDNISMAPKLSHQINRLLVQKKATIILTTSKRAGTVTDARNLITEANNLAPLEAIFFVSVVYIDFGLIHFKL